MAIKKIRVSNFKSFDDLEITLGDFNVLIGPNASGKSNFLSIFKFLRDISLYGLTDAISLQGGVEYLRNTVIAKTRPLTLEVAIAPRSREPSNIADVSNNKAQPRYKARELTYKFSLQFAKKGDGFRVLEDKVTCALGVRSLYRPQRGPQEPFSYGELIYSQVKGKIRPTVILPPNSGENAAEIERGLGVAQDALSGIERGLILQTPVLPIFSILLDADVDFLGISTYDFDPRLPKKAVPITGRTELEEDGSNLALVLKNILESKENKRKFTNLIKDLLPFVENLAVEKFADRSLLFKLLEHYNPKQYLPSSFISDGTINVAALLIVLFFEQNPFIIIEEPERNLHPALMAKVVGMLKEASEKKQVLVTTHNPEIVKHVDLQDLLFISRNDKGFSEISRPGEKESVLTFLQNEIGVDELFTLSLLGA